MINEAMKYAGTINTEARRLAVAMAVPGVKLSTINSEIISYIKSMDCNPAFLGYNGFPAAACLSVNNVAVHGVPTDYELKQADILKIDVGVEHFGFVTDAACTIVIKSEESSELYRSRKLLQYCNMQILNAGLSKVKDGASLFDLVEAMESSKDNLNSSLRFIESKRHITIIDSLCGHYIGNSLHIEPYVLAGLSKDPKIKKHQINESRKHFLREGDTLCVEPVITWGNGQIEVSKNDGWSVYTVDGSDASHVEACILVKKEGFEIIS